MNLFQGNSSLMIFILSRIKFLSVILKVKIFISTYVFYYKTTAIDESTVVLPDPTTPLTRI